MEMTHSLNSRLSVSVLGSGGPIANLSRASAGYLLSIDGGACILVDAGGGTFERIGRSGLDVSSLEQILLTHVHSTTRATYEQSSCICICVIGRGRSP